jgi:hypothetical protein
MAPLSLSKNGFLEGLGWRLGWGALLFHLLFFLCIFSSLRFSFIGIPKPLACWLGTRRKESGAGSYDL